MFGAVGLGGFAEDDGAAVGDEEVAGGAEGRVGGDAGVAVAAAALERDGEFGEGGWGAADVVGFVEDGADEGEAGFDGFADAAHGLDVHGADAVGKALFFEEAAELVHFAAEADDDDVGEVHVAGVAGQGAAQQAERLAVGHAAAGLVGEGDDAVDAGPGGERIVTVDGVAAELLGDEVGGVGAAVHARENADVVAGGDPAVGAVDAHEAALGVGAGGGAGVDAGGGSPGCGPPWRGCGLWM